MLDGWVFCWVLILFFVFADLFNNVDCFDFLWLLIYLLTLLVDLYVYA